MDWKFWLALIPAVIQAVFVTLDYFGVKPKSMQTEDTKRSTVKIMALLMLLTWGAVAYDLYDRNYNRPSLSSSEWDSYPLIKVRNKIFQGETVKLDGYEFINCDFDRVTFEYEGTAPTLMVMVRFKRYPEEKRMVGFKSSNPVVRQTRDLVRRLDEVATGLDFSEPAPADKPSE